MFNPSREQARSFFIDAWKKQNERLPLTPLETIAADIVAHHPEYHAILTKTDANERDFPTDDGQINPFLHLSLHLAIEEQLSIDQPVGLRAAFEQCQRQRNDRHQALHDVMESLVETLWIAQRHGTPLDGAAYVAAVKKKGGIL